jgi:hypothetical protein
MNTERLLREMRKRLEGFPDAERAEVLDALREEIARQRRRLDPSLTVESERERRLEAETLREVLEAINRQARLEDTIAEVLKQLSRIVVFDSCSLALRGDDGVFRIFAVRGFPEPSKIVGQVFRDPLSEEIREKRWPVTIEDVQQDDRFSKIEGTAPIRSWAGLPLLVEGEVLGILCLDRHRVEPFEEEDLHRAKAVAFSAAAAIRKAQLLEQVRRYATSMERVVAVDQAVFAGRPAAEIARLILEGALRVGTYAGGMLVLPGARGLQVAAAAGAFAGTEGRLAPEELATRATIRLGPPQLAGVCRALGVAPPEGYATLYLVPLASADALVGSLGLLDLDAETPDDRLMEAYAARAAAAYLHAVRGRR